MPEFAVPQVQGPLVAVAEVLAWDNSEGADGGQRATLRAAQRVLAITVEHPFAFGSTRQVELAQEHVSRIAAVTLTPCPRTTSRNPRNPRTGGATPILEETAAAVLSADAVTPADLWPDDPPPPTDTATS